MTLFNLHSRAIFYKDKKYKSITEVLNSVTSSSIRWCTPSIEPKIEKVINPYASDMSVSFSELGYPNEPSGIFAEAFQRAAVAYGAEKTLFSVNGSTGSNFVVLRTLSKQIPNLRILAFRNIHKSILDACQDYGINVLFVEANIDPHLQIFFPAEVDEVAKQIKKTKPHVLLVTSPTYDGLVVDLRKLIKVARETSPEIIVYVDEAWGAHLAFSDQLPESAMQCEADICVQSTHKHGGALQQSGMIHWNEKRIDTELLMESYRNLSTTSPSYLLLASIDAAREQLEKNGKKNIDSALKIATQLSNELNEIPDLHVVSLTELKQKCSAVFNKDETMVILDVTKTGYTGYTLAKFLEEEYNIIVEKANGTTLLFLVGFQNEGFHIKQTIKALNKIIKTHAADKNGTTLPLLEIPTNIPRTLELKEVTNLLQNQIETIPLEEAHGRISAENITPYPPGIPTTIQGEEITAKAISFYQSLHHYPNSHILAHDISLKTIRVVK